MIPRLSSTYPHVQMYSGETTSRVASNDQANVKAHYHNFVSVCVNRRKIVKPCVYTAYYFLSERKL